MSLSGESLGNRRRRGEELEKALLDAAWAELQERGYDALTFEAVAARAETSRAVLYRRWSTKAELVRAAIVEGMKVGRPTIPDTGSLREDTIEMLRRMNGSRARFAMLLTIQLGPYFAETGTSFVDLRRDLIADAATSDVVIMERAIARGEVDPERITPRIRSLPFDLLRAEFVMTFQSVADDVLVEIVDTIFLPLVLGESAPF